jgi:hypothetical protein
MFATVGDRPLFVKNSGKALGDDGDIARNCGPLIAGATRVKRIGRCVRFDPTNGTQKCRKALLQNSLRLQLGECSGGLADI